MVPIRLRVARMYSSVLPGSRLLIQESATNRFRNREPGTTRQARALRDIPDSTCHHLKDLTLTFIDDGPA